MSLIKAKKLSPTQIGVVLRLAEQGTRLERWPGGFWTYKGCPPRANSKIPSWHCGTQTVWGLESKGLLLRCLVHKEDWRDERVLSADGADIVAELLRAAAALKTPQPLPETRLL